MQQDFVLPKGALGRFAVVKLWPEIKTAEDECIARLKITAQVLGIECVEVHADGGLLTAPDIKVSRTNVDFVIHLHYDTPKRYDAYSFVALWNPVKFYHEWGYARTSRNLTTHDDFISCSSDAADDHVARMVRKTATHLPVHFRLYHSTADVMHPPSLGECKLFYAGINWEAISGGKSRHGEVLKLMDKTGLLRIYGPTIFQGVRVWAGYDSYVREVPFDGVSMIDEISKAGMALVLSSQAHKESELMSNRLFESVSAGALVICDENPFAKRFFGDALLYIDSRLPIEQMVTDIKGHVEWARTHPSQALAMIAQSQLIFRKKFTLIRNLRDLYSGLADRQLELRYRQNPPGLMEPRITLNLLMPEYSKALLDAHISSVNVQDYKRFTPTLVIDTQACNRYRLEVNIALASSLVPIELLEVDFYSFAIHSGVKSKHKLGFVITKLLQRSREFDAFMVVAPNEKLFSNHLAVLAGALQREAATECAATAAVIIKGDNPVHSVHELIDFGHVNAEGPTGYGRFIFRTSAIPADIMTALPYLDGRPLAVLVGNKTIAQQMPASVVIDISQSFPDRNWDDAVENEIIFDFNPQARRIATGFGPRPVTRHVEEQPANRLNLSLIFNPRWITAQINALKKQGVVARFKAFRRKFAS